MDIHLPRLPRLTFNPLLLLLAVLLGVAIAIIGFSANPPSAYASSSTGCGQAVCYVDSQVRGESDWASEPYVGSDGETVTPGSGGGGTPGFKSKYVGCSSWYPKSSNRLSFTYPAKNSNDYDCWFDDKAMNQGCPPTGDRASNGRVDYYIERVGVGGKNVWLFARFKCLYPTDPFAPIESEAGRGKIYTGGQGDFYQTMSTKEVVKATRSGVRTDTTNYVNRGVNLSNPEAWAGSWSPSFTAKTGTNANGSPMYGFYRLLWNLDYRICVKWSYPAWLNQPVRYDCSQAGTDTTVQPFTYACDTNPPLQRGVRSTALFQASDCVSSWQCVITGSTLVGGSTEPLTVMRNGQNTPVTNATPGVKIFDTSRVRNVRAWNIYRTPTPGSTPSLDYVKTSWKWEKWEPFTAGSQIAFNWASEPDRPFSWDSRYKFTADYLVPKQSGLDGAVSWVWVTQNRECLSSHSPDIGVVRSVNR